MSQIFLIKIWRTRQRWFANTARTRSKTRTTLSEMKSREKKLYTTSNLNNVRPRAETVQDMLIAPDSNELLRYQEEPLQRIFKYELPLIFLQIARVFPLFIDFIIRVFMTVDTFACFSSGPLAKPWTRKGGQTVNSLIWNALSMH